MKVSSREAKVFAALAISMTVGIVILQALGNNPPSAGAFCLSSYTREVPVEEAVLSRSTRPAGYWRHIEVYYSGTHSGNIQQLAFLGGLADPEDINCHFVICNGLGGGDGQIQPTERWQWQDPANRDWLNHKPQTGSEGHTIYICVIADYETVRPTDSQVKITKALAKKLSKKFDIPSESVHYPHDWL